MNRIRVTNTVDGTPRADLERRSVAAVDAEIVRTVRRRRRRFKNNNNTKYARVHVFRRGHRRRGAHASHGRAEERDGITRVYYFVRADPTRREFRRAARRTRNDRRRPGRAIFRGRSEKQTRAPSVAAAAAATSSLTFRASCPPRPRRTFHGRRRRPSGKL